MTETVAPDETPQTPELVFRKLAGKLRNRPPAPAAPDMRQQILRWIVYAGAAGLVILLLFSLGAGADRGRAAGGLLIFALAAIASGALTGFLFGIPRTLQGSAAAEGTSYQVNTNLEQISDWLTKIIVGLGLIHLKTIPTRLMELNEYVTKSLALKPPADAVIGSAAVFFASAGFLLGYLSTRLYISAEFRKADDDLLRSLGSAAEEPAKERAQPAKVLAEEVDSQKEKDVDERVSTFVQAAENSQASPSTVTPEVARQLARAYSASGDYARAVPFYERAGAQTTTDDELAIQYAFALGESGRHEEALAFLEDLHARGRGGSQVMFLLGYFFLWIPDHIDKAIGWTRLYLEDHSANQPALFNLACGYAQKYGRTKNKQYAQLAIEMLRRVISTNSGWRERARQLRNEDFASLSDEQFREATTIEA